MISLSGKKKATAHGITSVKASAYSQPGNKGAFLFRRRIIVSGIIATLVCSALHCETTFRADNASYGRLTASKACLRPFGGKDL